MNHSCMRRIVIIGGGITGLAAAHRLVELCRQSRQPSEVLLLEAGTRLGGVIRTYQRERFLLEAGADAFISEKPEAVELAKRIELGKHLIHTEPQHRRSFIVRKGTLRPVPNGFQLIAPSRLWPFVRSGICSWTGKARIALELFVPRGRSAASSDSEDESLAEFVRRRLGREALERIAQPMFAGLYTADPEKLSLAATMPRFLEMERQHGSVIHGLRKDRSPNSGTSGARYSLFLSFNRGMQVLVDRLAERIAECRMRNAELSNQRDSCIQLDTSVESLWLETRSEDNTPRWRMTTSRNETITADAVCLAVPAYVAAHLLRNVDAELAAQLGAIRYSSTATVNLAYRRADIQHPLNGFGFVVPFIEKRTLMACTFSSVKFARRAPADHALLRAFVGGALQPRMFELDEGEMVRGVCEDLRELLGIQKPPLFALLEKWPGSMPQYHVGHINLVKRIEQRAARLPGLELAGNAYGGPGIPDCVRSGEAAAGKIIKGCD